MLRWLWCCGFAVARWFCAGVCVCAPPRQNPHVILYASERLQDAHREGRHLPTVTTSGAHLALADAAAAHIAAAESEEQRVSEEAAAATERRVAAEKEVARRPRDWTLLDQDGALVPSIASHVGDGVLELL